MTDSTKSFRYPWPCHSIEDVAREVRNFPWHDRRGVFGVLCSWLPDPKRVVGWAEAVGMVKAAKETANA